MDSLFGLVGGQGEDGFVLMAADTCSARSILVFKRDEDKIMDLDGTKLLANSGPTADRANFTEYIQKNMSLYALNNELSLSTHAAANYTRGQLAQALRSKPYQVNLLLGGYDEGEGSSLFWMDYFGTMQKMNFGAHGYAANFCLSIFDKEWKANLTLEEALDILKKCKKEIETRFLIAQPTFKVKIVDKNGTRVLDNL